MEISKIVDQRVRKFLEENEDRLARQGSIVSGYRQRDGRRWGPYFRLMCRLEDGRQTSVYLGANIALVDQVRDCLSELQAPIRDDRCLRKVRLQIRRELAIVHIGLSEQIVDFGLFLHGNDVRGWSSCAVNDRFRGDGACTES